MCQTILNGLLSKPGLIIVIVAYCKALDSFAVICCSEASLRSSRFRFLQAKRGKRARALGKKEQKSRSRGEGPSRAYPAWLEGNGNDYYPGYSDAGR